MTLLRVHNLSISLKSPQGLHPLVRDFSLEIPENSALALVGESGCGKSVTAMALLRLLPNSVFHIDSGQVLYQGKDLYQLAHDELQKIRGREISVIFQEPMSALNPVFSIGNQLRETLCQHLNLSRHEAEKKAEELLHRVGVTPSRQRLKDFPHQLSGGMRQRVMIALALASQPKLLIADEPTTALDATIQAQIIDLLRDLQAEFKMSLLMISHDLHLVSQLVEQLFVMYAGQIVERGEIHRLLARPSHPYTQALLSCIPRGNVKGRLTTIPGRVPDPRSMPPGCSFAQRCAYVFDRCKAVEPTEISVHPQQHRRCLLPDFPAEIKDGVHL